MHIIAPNQLKAGEDAPLCIANVRNLAGEPAFLARVAGKLLPLPEERMFARVQHAASGRSFWADVATGSLYCMDTGVGLTPTLWMTETPRPAQRRVPKRAAGPV